MTTNAHAAPSFDLKNPKHYFTNPATIELLAAAMSGNLVKVKQAVDKGGNPNDEGPIENKYSRLRPLHYAIAARNKEAIKVLISVGADPELSVVGLGEAFLFVITLENVDMMSLLLTLRPLETLSRRTLKSMMFESVSQPCQECLELLLDRGAPIDFPDDADYTILMRTMDTQDYDMAEWLLERGASVHIETYSGMTPAYSVQFHLNKYKPGSPTYNKVLHLKKMMEERGAVFPAPSPAEIRARREQQKR